MTLATNPAPIPFNKIYNVQENTINTFNVLTGVTDGNSDLLAVRLTRTSIDLVNNTSLLASNPYTFNVDGTITYNASYFDLPLGGERTDIFTFTIYDGSAKVTGTLTINLLGVAPVARTAGQDDRTVSAGQTTTLTDLLNNDNVLPFGGISSLQNVGPGVEAVTAQGGVIKFEEGSYYNSNLIYTPKVGFVGEDFFTYSAFIDIEGSSVSQAAVTVFVKVLPPLNPPTIQPIGKADLYQASSNAIKNISAADGVLVNDDLNGGDILRATIVAGPTKGVLDFNVDGSFSFDPNGQFNSLGAGQSETVTFTYAAFNGRAIQSGSTQVSIVVTNPDVVVKPTAVNDDVSTNEDTSFAITTLLGNDSASAGGTLSDIRISTLPAGGVLTLNGSTITANAGVTAAELSTGHLLFVPNLDFNGSTSFQYQVNNGQAYSDMATVSVTVNAVNDAPLAIPNSNVIFVGNTFASSPALALLANDIDPDAGDTLSLTAIGYKGDFRNGSDILSHALIGKYGELTITDNSGAYSYVANQPASHALAGGQNVHDVFDYTVTDSGGESSSSKLDMFIMGVNDGPTALNDTVELDGNTTISIDLRDNDSDPDTGDSLYVTGFRAGSSGAFLSSFTDAYGTLTVNSDGTVSFLANGTDTTALAAGTTATDVVSYQIKDAAGLTANATLTINITGVNDSPVSVEDSIRVNEKSTANGYLLTNDSDPDQGDSVSVVGVRAVGGELFDTDAADTYGTLHINPDGSYSFTADGTDSNALAAGVTHVDNFEYRVKDSTGLTSIANLAVTIIGVNDVPVAVEIRLDVNEEQAIDGSLLTNDSDLDQGDTVRVSSISLSNGTVLNIDDNVTNDGAYGSLNVSSTGSYSFIANGSAANILGAGQTKVETFGYTINDDSNASSSANIIITIKGVNDAPTANGNIAAVNENTTTTIYLLVNDSDPDDGDSIRVTGLRLGDAGEFTNSVTDAYGTLTLADDGTVSFKANSTASNDLAVGVTVSDNFSYQIADAAGLNANAVLTIYITGTNDAPTARNDNYSYNNIAGSVFTVSEGNGVLHHIDAGESVDDSDNNSGDILTVAGASTILTTAAGQHVTLASNGSFVYDATDGFYGHDSFDYSVSDGHGGTSTATVNLTVTAPPKLADRFLINEIAVNTGSATLTINTDNGDDPNNVTTGPAHIEIIKNSNTATSSAELRSMQVEIVNPNGGLSVISMSQLVGLTVDKVGNALNLSSAITAGGSLELFEPNSSGLGIWAVYDSKGTLKLSGTYHDNAWQLGADVTAPIAINLAQAGASLDLFIANGAAIFDLHGIDTAQGWLSGVGTLGTAPHALGSVSPFVLPEKLFAWYGGAQLLPADVPADVTALLAANQQFNGSLASSADSVFVRVYDNYLNNGIANGLDKVFIDNNDAGDWTYGQKMILSDGYKNIAGKDSTKLVPNPLDPYDNMNPLQGTGKHGDVIASITNEDGQTIAIFSGFGTGGNGHDFLYGVNSDDVLLGASGDDFIYGSGGNDTLWGGSGGDNLSGGAGNDVLYGGTGKDKFMGGIGVDVFVYLDTNESAVALADVISDFTHGVDKIDLTFIDAKLSLTGNQVFGFGGNKTTTVANSVTWFESNGNTIIQIDNTGNTVADMQLVLAGVSLGLTATDFVL